MAGSGSVFLLWPLTVISCDWRRQGSCRCLRESVVPVARSGKTLSQVLFGLIGSDGCLCHAPEREMCLRIVKCGLLRFLKTIQVVQCAGDDVGDSLRGNVPGERVLGKQVDTAGNRG